MKGNKNMQNELEDAKKQITSEYDYVIEDSKQIRAILSNTQNLSKSDLEFIKARIGNNKTVNVALNGKITMLRLSDRIGKGK